MSNRNPEVDTWLANYANPQRALVAKIRDFVMDVSPELSEAVKWQAPTFIYKGNIASFFPPGEEERHPDVPPGCFHR